MESIERIFDGVTLTATPECVYGTVSQEEASKAIKRHAIKSIQKGNFVEAELCLVFDHAVKLRYMPVELKETEVVNSEKEIIMRVIEKAIDQNLLNEVIVFATQDDSDSWATSLLRAESVLLK